MQQVHLPRLCFSEERGVVVAALPEPALERQERWWQVGEAVPPTRLLLVLQVQLLIRPVWRKSLADRTEQYSTGCTVIGLIGLTQLSMGQKLQFFVSFKKVGRSYVKKDENAPLIHHQNQQLHPWVLPMLPELVSCFRFVRLFHP